jgi:predicted glutamine amidotransferase
VRYPTAGTPSAQEAQPFFVNSPLGIFLIHNGNITNAAALREGLNSSDSFFNRHLRTDSDSEVSAGGTGAADGLFCLRTPGVQLFSFAVAETLVARGLAQTCSRAQGRRP